MVGTQTAAGTGDQTTSRSVADAAKMGDGVGVVIEGQTRGGGRLGGRWPGQCHRTRTASNVTSWRKARHVTSRSGKGRRNGADELTALHRHVTSSSWSPRRPVHSKASIVTGATGERVSGRAMANVISGISSRASMRREPTIVHASLCAVSVLSSLRDVTFGG